MVEKKLAVNKACDAMKLSRSAWYRPLEDKLARDSDVIDALEKLVKKHQGWGFWLCFQRLRNLGHRWNHKRVYRVYKALGLNHRRKTKRRVITRERQPLEVAPVPNAVWSVDFVHDTLYSGRRFRTLNVMDEGVRECLAIEIDTSLPGARLVRTLEQLKASQGVPAAIRCDNGPELISRRFVDWCEENNVQIKYIQPGKPNQNAYIERFNRTYRNEVLSCYLFEDLDDVQSVYSNADIPDDVLAEL